LILIIALKNRLADVGADCRDGLYVGSSESLGASNSHHIHGTHVPVEEPSTASIAEIDHRYNVTLP